MTGWIQNYVWHCDVPRVRRLFVLVWTAPLTWSVCGKPKNLPCPWHGIHATFSIAIFEDSIQHSETVDTLPKQQEADLPVGLPHLTVLRILRKRSSLVTDWIEFFRFWFHSKSFPASLLIKNTLVVYISNNIQQSPTISNKINKHIPRISIQKSRSKRHQIKSFLPKQARRHLRPRLAQLRGHRRRGLRGASGGIARDLYDLWASKWWSKWGSKWSSDELIWFDGFV